MKLEQLGEGVIPEFAHTVDRVANGGIPVGDLLVNPLGVYLIQGLTPRRIYRPMARKRLPRPD